MKPIDRHARDCSVCKHRDRASIETDFIAWEPVTRIAKEYKLGLRALYRHARALQLFAAREKNLRGALGQIIQKGMAARRVSPAQLIQALALAAKLDGVWIDRTENVNETREREHKQMLFARMTRSEMLRYAETGQLPAWALPDTSLPA